MAEGMILNDTPQLSGGEPGEIAASENDAGQTASSSAIQTAADQGQNEAAAPSPVTLARELRAKLENARGKIAGGKRSNMLDQIADGVCEAIDAILETLGP
jgi:hypothetical protein